MITKDNMKNKTLNCSLIPIFSELFSRSAKGLFKIGVLIEPL